MVNSESDTDWDFMADCIAHQTHLMCSQVLKFVCWVLESLFGFGDMSNDQPPEGVAKVAMKQSATSASAEAAFVEECLCATLHSEVEIV